VIRTAKLIGLVAPTAKTSHLQSPRVAVS
jgi:hypothetical protein